MSQYILTSGTSWTPPAGVTNIQIECIGAGGISTSSTGGPGAYYSKKANLVVTPGVPISYQIGNPSSPTIGLNTWFKNTTTVLAPGGGSGSSPIGDLYNAGGAGGGPYLTRAGGGGGGAGGPSGVGQNGFTATIAQTGGNGGAGDNSLGGVGGVGHFQTDGGTGGSGTEWTTVGSGGGGGGFGYDPFTPVGYDGGTGGNYGGGGGQSHPTAGVPSLGGAGLIVITDVSATYTNTLISWVVGQLNGVSLPLLNLPYTKLQNYNNQFTFLNNRLNPANQVTWINQSGNIWTYTLPQNMYLVGVRDLSNVPWGECDNLTHLPNNSLYTYDEVYQDSTPGQSGTKVYIWSNTNPASSVFLDFYQDPSTTYTEVCTVSKGKIYLSYSPVYNLVLTRGNLTQSVTGSANNPITPTIAGEGQWVKATYNIDKSFCITTHDTIQTWVKYPYIVGVKWEQGGPNTKIPIYNSDGSYLDFNPINPNSYYTGYLTFSNLVPTIPTAGGLYIQTDRISYSPSWGEYVFVHVAVNDINGLPIPNKPITLTTNGTITSFASTSSTDNQGKIDFYVTAPSGNISIVVTADTLSGSALITGNVVPLSVTTVTGSYQEIVITKDLTSYGGLSSFVTKSYIDGTPYPSSVVSVYSQNGTNFSYTNFLGNLIQGFGNINVSTQSTPLNPQGISPTISISPTVSDKVWCADSSGQSKILDIKNNK